VDETYVKVAGEWKYLYRAVDRLGHTDRDHAHDQEGAAPLPPRCRRVRRRPLLQLDNPLSDARLPTSRPAYCDRAGRDAHPLPRADWQLATWAARRVGLAAQALNTAAR